MGTASRNSPATGFVAKPIAEVHGRAEEATWLIESIWASEACGLIGATPKTGKTWLGLSMALAVASGTKLFGEYAVTDPGPALVFPAEGSSASIRNRVDMLAAASGVEVADLPLHLLDTDALHLDDPEHRTRFELTLEALRPKIVVLDPLVRLHTGHESDTQHVSELLGYLRSLQRRFAVAIVVTHHLGKGRSGSASGGERLRGSGDLHAWGDSNLYLTKLDGGVVQCDVEQRDAEALEEPLNFKLTVGSAGASASLELVEAPEPPEPPGGRSILRPKAPTAKRTPKAPLGERVLAAIRESGEPRSQKRLRTQVGCNNQRLTDALRALQAAGKIERNENGWALTPEELA